MSDAPVDDGEWYSTPDSTSILLVTKHNTIRIYCPFQVECKIPITPFENGDRATVSQVLAWDDRTLLYRINNKLYPHPYFQCLPLTRL